MIEFLLPDPPTKFAKEVISWGNGIASLRSMPHTNHNNAKPRMIKSKSYELGAYPRNVIGEKDYD